MKSRCWCQWRDGADGNLDGDVEVEGVHNSSLRVRVRYRKERSKMMRKILLRS